MKMAFRLFDSRKSEQTARSSLEFEKFKFVRLEKLVKVMTYSFSTVSGAAYWSDSVKSILGYRPSGLESRPMLWHDSIHPDDIETVNKALQDLPVTGGFSPVYRIQDTNGNWRWLLDESVR